MDIHQVERNIGLAVTLLKALSNESRLLIICALHKGEKSVSELERIAGLSQSALSQHLSRLRQEGLVVTKRRAQNVYYKLNDEATTKVLHTLHEIYQPTEEPVPIPVTVSDPLE